MDLTQAIQANIDYLIWTIEQSITELNNIPKEMEKYSHTTIEKRIEEAQQILSARLAYALTLGKA